MIANNSGKKKKTGSILLLRDRPSTGRKSLYYAKVQLTAVSHIR